MGKYKRLEVFYLSKPVYTADKPSDCHYCYFWTNGRKGCRLGRNNCYYLISLPPKPKSECDGCPYGRDHPCIGWCTKKVMREVDVYKRQVRILCAGGIESADPYRKSGKRTSESDSGYRRYRIYHAERRRAIDDDKIVLISNPVDFIFQNVLFLSLIHI